MSTQPLKLRLWLRLGLRIANAAGTTGPMVCPEEDGGAKGRLSNARGPRASTPGGVRVQPTQLAPQPGTGSPSSAPGDGVGTTSSAGLSPADPAGLEAPSEDRLPRWATGPAAPRWSEPFTPPLRPPSPSPRPRIRPPTSAPRVSPPAPGFAHPHNPRPSREALQLEPCQLPSPGRLFSGRRPRPTPSRARAPPPIRPLGPAPCVACCCESTCAQRLAGRDPPLEGDTLLLGPWGVPAARLLLGNPGSPRTWLDVGCGLQDPDDLAS